MDTPGETTPASPNGDPSPPMSSTPNGYVCLALPTSQIFMGPVGPGFMNQVIAPEAPPSRGLELPHLAFDETLAHDDGLLSVYAQSHTGGVVISPPMQGDARKALEVVISFFTQQLEGLADPQVYMAIEALVEIEGLLEKPWLQGHWIPSSHF